MIAPGPKLPADRLGCAVSQSNVFGAKLLFYMPREREISINVYTTSKFQNANAPLYITRLMRYRQKRHNNKKQSGEPTHMQYNVQKGGGGILCVRVSPFVGLPGHALSKLIG